MGYATDANYGGNLSSSGVAVSGSGSGLAVTSQVYAMAHHAGYFRLAWRYDGAQYELGSIRHRYMTCFYRPIYEGSSTTPII